jgi:hypothetical protein
MNYDNKVSLAGFLQCLTYTRPEEHVKLILHTCSFDGEDFEEIYCNVYNVSKYADYPVNNIMIEDCETLSVMIDVDDC